MTSDSGFESAWAVIEPGAKRSLELAYASLVAAGLACGAAITDASGAVVAEGRNRAYDPPGGRDALQGTPLAHAEMNALADVSTYRDLSTCTLWSSHEPCSMCTAAATFTGVGTVRYLAPDPGAVVAGRSRSGPGAGRDALPAAHPGSSPLIFGPVDDDRWVIAANVMFLLSIARLRGLEHPTIVGNADLEPDTAMVVRQLVGADSSAELPLSADAFVADWWNALCTAAGNRAAGRRVSDRSP
jgi:tRNA(Arg) A34 adenosine deaminase TadA